MERTRHLSYRSKVFLFLMISAVIPIIILGIYSYNTYRIGINKEVNLTIDSSAKQLKIRMDSTMNSIRKYYLAAVQTEEIEWLMNEDIWYSDYSRLTKAQDTLKSTYYLSEYITGYTFINWDTGWVLSNRGLYPFSLSLNPDEVKAFKGDDQGWVNHMDQVTPGNLRREEIDLEGVLYYVNLPVTRNEKNSMLTVNVDLNRINSVVLDDQANVEIMIIDGDGKLVYSTHSDLSKVLLQRDASSDQQSQITLNAKNTYQIGSLKSDVVDWTYYVAWGTQRVNEGAANIVLMTIAVVLGFALIIILATLFTRAIYRPVHDLSDYVTEASGILQQNYTDDFTRISGSVDRLVDSNTALEQTIENQRSQLCEFFMTRLINGTLYSEQIDMYVKQLGIVMQDYYLVMTIGLKNLMNEDYDEMKQDALRLQVMENIPEEIRTRLAMPPASNSRVITVVVTDNNSKDLEKKAIEVYKGIDIFVQMEYQFAIKVGVSSIYSDLKQFRNAHSEGIEALKNNEVLHEKNTSSDFEGVMFYTDIERNYESRVYDRLMEREIKTAVDSGDQEKAFEIVDQFVQHLIDHQVAKMEQQFYIHHFMDEILMVTIEAGISPDEIFTGGRARVYQSVNQIYDLERLRSFYKYGLVVPIIERLNQFRTSKSSEIIQEIMNLIEETGGDITLNECADRLNYHTTYIWKVMKVEKNSTFTEYVAEYKLEAAKKLLLTTSMTITDIAKELNYTNAQNFIRFFSRMEGTTPGKYRKKNKSK